MFSVQVFGQNYILKTIPVRNELNTALIASQPFIDKDGFVWYAVNNEGMFCKYDGRNQISYNVFKKSNKRVTTLISNIFSWIQDTNNNIWAINAIGAYVINPKTFAIKYIKWKIAADIKDCDYIASLLDSNGNVWISVADNYIIKFDKKYKQILYKLPGKFKEQKTSKNAREIIYGSNRITFKIIRELSGGRMLVQSYYNIYIIDKKGLHLLMEIKNPNLTIQFIENGKIFKKNCSGIYSFNNKKYEYRYIKELNLQMFDYPYNNFLFTGLKFFTIDGNKIYLSVIDRDNLHIKNTDTIILKKNILNHHLYLGKDNIIWFSAYDNIYMLKTNDVRFRKHLQLPDHQFSTRGIVADKTGNLYIGTYSGIIKLNARTGAFSNVYISNDPLSNYNAVLIENDSVLWVDGESNKIKSINLNTNKSIIRNHEIKFNISYFIKEKSKDYLWVGSDKGLFTFNKLLGTITEYKISTINNHDLIVYDLLQNKSGDLWIATNKGLFFKRKGKSCIDFSTRAPFFKDKIVIVLHEDKNKNLWVGTNNVGIIHLDLKKGKIEIYDQSNGLSNNTVCGILESEDQMWFSTFYGLSALNKTTKKFSNYYLQDGLSENEFNMRSFYKKDDYSFYFGGINGITEFNPKNFKIRKKSYKVFLSKSQYFSKKMNKNVTDYINDFSDVELPYDKNYFSAEFTINDMYEHEKSTYHYRIQGLTDGWVNSGISGLVKLYNLPAGDHVLEIKGKDFEGEEAINIIKINIKVEQVFFKKPWFIVLIILMISGFIVYQFRRKAKKQQIIFERQQEIITLKANALKAQMNPHFIFNILNNIQSVMFLKGEVEANKYFGAFSRLLRLTLDMSKQELVSLKDELEYINYYLILNNLQLNEKLNFSITAPDIEGEKIFIPGMLIQPFVENAIVHGLSPKEKGEKIIEIKCFVEDGFLIVNIEDNGIGREASAKLVKNREYVYKSWSTTIVKERIYIINISSLGQEISLKIDDKKSDNQSLGTIVTLKFKI